MDKRGQKMKVSIPYKMLLAAVYVTLFVALTPAQKHSKHSGPNSEAVLWRPVNVARQDLFLGPGGAAMEPDLSSITFLEERKGDRKSTRLNSSHVSESRMPSSACKK